MVTNNDWGVRPDFSITTTEQNSILKIPLDLLGFYISARNPINTDPALSLEIFPFLGRWQIEFRYDKVESTIKPHYMRKWNIKMYFSLFFFFNWSNDQVWL